jgi:hypothetical protein
VPPNLPSSLPSWFGVAPLGVDAYGLTWRRSRWAPFSPARGILPASTVRRLKVVGGGVPLAVSVGADSVAHVDGPPISSASFCFFVGPQ